MATEPHLERSKRLRLPLADTIQWSIVPALAVFLFGLFRVDDTSLWMDETFSSQAIQGSFRDLLRFLWSEAGMGPWYLTLWAWARVTDFSGEMLRLWSVTGAALAVGIFGSLLRQGKLVPSERKLWGLLAFLLLICHPSFLLAMTEARAYAWMITGAVASMSFLIRFSDTFRLRYLVALAISAGVSAGLHPVSLYLQSSILLLALVHGWSRVSRFKLVGSAVVAMLLAAPFYLVTLRSGANQTEWIGPLTIERVARTLTNFLGGVPGAFVVVPLVLTAVATSIRRRPRGPAPLPVLIAHFRLEILICLPIALLFLQSLVVNGFSGRYLTPIVPVLVLEALKGARILVELSSVKRLQFGPVVLSVVVLIAVPQELLIRERDRGGAYREIAAQLNTRVWEETHLVVMEPTLAQGTWFYASVALKGAYFPQPDEDPRPWDQFEHPIPVGIPTTCRFALLSSTPYEVVSEDVASHFGTAKNSFAPLNETELEGAWLTEFERSDC